MGERLVPPGLLRAAREYRNRRAQSAGSGELLRSHGTGREEARPARRIVPLHGPVLHPVHGGHAGQGRGSHRQQPRRVPLREGLNRRSLERRVGTRSNIRPRHCRIRHRERRKHAMKLTVIAVALALPAVARAQGTQSAPAPAAVSAAQKSLSQQWGLSVFPAKNQTKEVQDKDEYDCYQWSKQNTGIDPLAPGQSASTQPATQQAGGAVKGAAKGAAAGAVVG